MSSLGDRVGWLENDVRSLASKLEHAAWKADGHRRSERSDIEAARRDAERLNDDVARELRSFRARLDEAEAAVRSHRQDTINGIVILADRLTMHRLAICALAIVCAAEAWAIWLLWR